MWSSSRPKGWPRHGFQKRGGAIFFGFVATFAAWFIQWQYQWGGMQRYYLAHYVVSSAGWFNKYPSGALVLRSYMYDTNTLDSTFSGSYTQGRLVAVQNAQLTPGNGSLVTWTQMVEMYGYTQPGSVSGKRLQVNEHIPYPAGNGQTLTRDLDAAYTYNNEGKMTSVNYPTTWTYNSGGVAQSTPGPTYTYSFDSMYRLAGMTDQNNNTDVSNVTYNAANQLTGVSYFGSGETRQYNSLGQMTQLSASSALYYNYNYPTGANNGKISSTYEALSGEQLHLRFAQPDDHRRRQRLGRDLWLRQLRQSHGQDPLRRFAAQFVASPEPGEQSAGGL
jgi:hypothetical protein